MRFQILFVAVLIFFFMYEIYFKQIFSNIFKFGYLIIGLSLLVYLYYTYHNNPKDFKTTLHFIQNLLVHSEGNTLKQLDRIIEGKPKFARQVSSLMKKKIAASQKWQCGHCNTILEASYEVDHILALYKGGSNDEKNLIALCRNCHGRKTVEERLSPLPI